MNQLPAYGMQNYGTNSQNASPMGTPANGMPIPVNQFLSNTITNSIVWVETEEEAKNWMVGPNNRVFVFVGDNEVLYVKEKNSDGRPLKTEIYDLAKRQTVEEGDVVDLSGYVRKEDVSAMIDEAVSKALAESKKNRNFQNGRNGYRNGGNNE